MSQAMTEKNNDGISHRMEGRPSVGTMAMPTWISELQALAVPIIALAAAGVALQQSRLAKQKLRLDLFERRSRVYDVVLQGMIDALNFNEENVLDQPTHGLNRTLREARFLFRASTYDYLTQIETKIM